jgi:type I restriction enzyme S subunit
LLEEYEFPLPPLADQQRAAELFDRADRLRRIRQRSIELSDSVIPAAFLELFGGLTESRFATVEECALAKANAIRTGPFGSQLLHSEFTSAGIAVLGIDNAVQNRFAWGRPRFISKTKFAGLKRYQVYPDDVLITIMGTLGRCAIVPADVGEAISTKHLCCVTVDQEICLPGYLHGAFLYHPFVQRQLRSASKGAIMDGLNMEIIRGLKIPLPPIPLQEAYVRLASAQAHMLAVQMESMRLAEHLLESLLDRTLRSASVA